MGLTEMFELVNLSYVHTSHDCWLLVNERRQEAYEKEHYSKRLRKRLRKTRKKQCQKSMY